MTTDADELKKRDAWGVLYEAANLLIARIAANGTICSDDKYVDAIMDALHEIDGGEYTNGMRP